ncbi:8387_t:CDS:1 [Dentiscutata erythropus]|uniref:8387_t:CDS:1 n=1 Tax=Dentiscutata erythropus TaxID=1348616 RepID=A0A9N9PD32_9GLOM|nr:8387_t:CDS:1 [Dentiscutata erythropus]
MYYNILSSLDCMIEILQDKKYINKKINFDTNFPNDLLTKLENKKQTRLNQSIKILKNIKISIIKTCVLSDLETNNTIYKKIEHKDSCLSEKNKKSLHQLRTERLEHLLIFVKLNKEIENLKEYKIPDYKNHERLKSNFLNDLKQELKEFHQKKLDFLKYLNEI